MASRFAAALSEHPVAAAAAGEVVGEILDKSGPSPDVAVLFCSPPNDEFLSELSATVRTLLAPGSFVACTASSVLGGRRHAEDGPAISLWAGWCGPVEAVAVDGPGAVFALGARPDATALVLAHEYSVDVEALLAAFDDIGVVVAGGCVSGSSSGAGMMVGGERVDAGAVAVVFGSTQVIGPVLAEGHSPVAPCGPVTAVAGRHVVTLDNSPASAIVETAIELLTPEDRRLLKRGIDAVLVGDDGETRVGIVRGIDKAAGVVALEDRPRLGESFLLSVRHPGEALNLLRAAIVGIDAPSALAFVDVARDPDLFGRPDSDAEEVVDMLGTVEVAGVATVRQFGPRTTRNRWLRRGVSVLTFAR